MHALLAEHGPRMSEWLRDLVAVALAGALAVGLALILHRIVFALLRRLARASGSTADDAVVRHLYRPTRWSLVVLALVIAARAIPALANVWQLIAGFAIPALVGWMALALLRALVEAGVQSQDITAADNLQARRRRTRLTIFSRIATFIIVFVTLGLMLLSIPGVRDVGVTLMASAGLAGLAVGAAAQPALKSLIAGLQMALTEPIRIDDVVVVDGEWGRIEDIRTTFVVVRTWDERRLVVPSTKFLEETFQNWTREGSAISGTVFLHLDPLVAIDPIRTEFTRLIAQHPLWDGRMKNLQVTNTTRESVEIRLLVSSANAGDNFNLRCDIREAMLAWLRDNHPEAVARQRVEPAAALPLEALGGA